jgi:hypothetical protein
VRFGSPVESSRSIPWISPAPILLFTERTSTSRRSSYTDAFFGNGYDVNTLLMSYLYVMFCGQTKHVLRLSVCSASTSPFRTRDNSYDNREYGYKVGSLSAYGPESSGTSWAPIGHPADFNFLETVLLGLTGVAPLAAYQKGQHQNAGLPR